MPGIRKKPKVTDGDNNDQDEEVLPIKDRGTKCKPRTPATRGRRRAAKGKPN